jgi:hypothetical protein
MNGFQCIQKQDQDENKGRRKGEGEKGNAVEDVL